MLVWWTPSRSTGVGRWSPRNIPWLWSWCWTSHQVRNESLERLSSGSRDQHSWRKDRKYVSAEEIRKPIREENRQRQKNYWAQRQSMCLSGEFNAKYISNVSADGVGTKHSEEYIWSTWKLWISTDGRYSDQWWVKMEGLPIRCEWRQNMYWSGANTDCE